MRFTYYGHSCFSVETGGKILLFDPFITPNEKAKDIKVDEIKADYILVSHAHADHTADLEKLARITGAKIISNWEIITYLENKGIQNGHPMNTGGSFEFDFGKVRCTSAQHSSSWEDGTYGGNPMGFIIDTVDGNFYYSGDTALTLDMQLIPRWSKLQFAVLPIGSNFTMDADDAIEAAKMCGAQTVVGVHYDTFGYIVIDHEASKNKFKAAGLELLLPGIGETKII